RHLPPLPNAYLPAGWGDGEAIQYLHGILHREVDPYTEIVVPKWSGGTRTLLSPDPRLMSLQRYWLRAWLNQAVPHPCAMAYRQGTSVLECASRHLGADTVVRLDIQDFFSSIRERHVFRALRRLRTPFLVGSRLGLYQATLLLTAP